MVDFFPEHYEILSIRHRISGKKVTTEREKSQMLTLMQLRGLGLRLH